MRRIAVLDAPSNLGLRPPTATSVPGCAKAPGALRDHGLLRRLNARDAGCLTPPRYDPGDWRPGDGVCHAPEISAYSRKLADRIGGILDQGEFPVVLGGDCSILLGSALAMHRLGEAVGGRIGLVFVDGHSDFRHPGNASYVGAAAGEDLALVTGRGQTDLAAMEGRRPYYRDIDVVVMGIRAQDEYRLDLQAAGIVTRPVPTLRVEGAARSAQWARDQLVDCAGYWVHIDVDVLDPAVMPAVDAPEPGGIAFPELEILLAGLVESPHCLGVELTVFDPDYDPDGKYAEEITSAIVAGLKPAQLVDARPDLVAARRDLAGPGRLGPGRLSPGRLSPGRLGPGRLAPGRLGPGQADPDQPGSDQPGSDQPGSDQPGSDQPGADRAGADRAGSGAGSGDERDPVEARRAAAAGDDVRMAAAAMSGGGSTENPEESAAPATTLLGVEEAGEVAAHPATGDSSDEAEFRAFSRRAEYHFASRGDEIGGLSRGADVSQEGESFDEPGPGPGATDPAADEVSADTRPSLVHLEPQDFGGTDPDSVRVEGFSAQGLAAEGFAAEVLAGGCEPVSDPDRSDRELEDDSGLPAAEPGSGAAGFDAGDGPASTDDLVADAAGGPVGGPAGGVTFEDPGAEPDHAAADAEPDLSAVDPAAADPAFDVVEQADEAVLDGQEGAVAEDPSHDNSASGEVPSPAAPDDVVLDGSLTSDAQDDSAPDNLSSDAPGDDGPERQPGDAQVRGPMRPLGPAPLLDSKPLPATMPGMLRPRPIEDFTLPAQRPAFEVGPEQPADLG